MVDRLDDRVDGKGTGKPTPTLSLRIARVGQTDLTIPSPVVQPQLIESILLTRLGSCHCHHVFQTYVCSTKQLFAEAV